MLACLRARRGTLLSLALLVPAGFCGKFYRGPLHVWVNDSLGGTFYVMFWCLAVSLLWPRAASARIAGGVLAATCALEFLQPWHPPFLEMLRSHFLGATILGTTFDWTDFPYYFLGAGAGWFWVNQIKRGFPS